jgi:integral membrane protein (TIGR01906 family)
MRKEVFLSSVLALLIIVSSFVVLINNEALAVGLTEKYSASPDAVNNTAQLFGYFRSEAQMPSVFSEKEVSHLEDVKTVFDGINIFFVLLLILFIGLLFLTNIPTMFQRGGVYALVLLAVFAVLPFRWVFTLMHKILFPQGNWTFELGSTLIQYYPHSFWNQYYLIAGVMIVILSLLFILAGWILKKKAIVSKM